MSTEHSSVREINREGGTNGHHWGSARQRCRTTGKGQGRGPVCLAKVLEGRGILEASLIRKGNFLKVDKVVDTPGQGQKHGCGLDRGVEGQWNPHRARHPCREKPQGRVHWT